MYYINVFIHVGYFFKRWMNVPHLAHLNAPHLSHLNAVHLIYVIGNPKT